MLSGASSVAIAAEDVLPPDVCLEVVAGGLPPGAWANVLVSIGEMTTERTALFPEPSVEDVSDPAAGEPGGGAGDRVDISASKPSSPDPSGRGDCLRPGSDWTMRIGRGFLERGADRMLAEAPTTPGIESSVSLEWHPSEDRVRTTLVFAGPLDIPNGTCWIDDALSVDAATGSVLVDVEHGVKTSLFAEGACRRFFDHLADGGAAEQATKLLPSEVDLADGSTLHFRVSEAAVWDDGIVLSGALDVR